jgi:hypothetical protein
MGVRRPNGPGQVSGSFRSCRPGALTQLRGSVARPVLGIVERKAASRSGLLPVMEADAHLRTDPQLAKTSGGEQRAHVSPDPDATFRPRMPVGEQTAGGSLGTISYPARPTARYAGGQLWHLFCRFLSGRGLSCHPDFPNPMPARESSLAGLEGGEVAPAGFTAHC